MTSKLAHLFLFSILWLPQGGLASVTSARQPDVLPPAGWSVDFVDSVDPGFYVHYSYTSLAVDDDDRAHVSYRGPEHDLRYATNKSDCWFAQTVHDVTPSVARENSIALDSANRSHISFSYSDGSAEDLAYANNVAGAWLVTPIDTTLSTGMENDIAIDGNDRSHISHWQWSGGELKYSTNTTGDWVTEVIDRASWARTSIALDNDSHAHVVYTGLGAVKYASNAGGAWGVAVIDSYGSHPSIDLDANGKAHVSYASGGNLKYATNASGPWSTTVIANVDVGRDHAIAVDLANNVHISFYDPTEGSLKYANNGAGSWSILTIDDSGDVGRSSSIAVDSNQKIHISYRDDSTPAMLKYATDATNRCHRLFLPIILKPMS